MADTSMGSPSNWAGYLLAKPDGTVFPHNLIKLETYDVLPNIREEIRAWRDDYTRNLHRITADGTKTKIMFETVDNLDINEAFAIMNFFYSGESDHLQRQVTIRYWDPEYFHYETGVFYRPDIQFKIRDITYGLNQKGFPITLVEY